MARRVAREVRQDRTRSTACRAARFSGNMVQRRLGVIGPLVVRRSTSISDSHCTEIGAVRQAFIARRKSMHANEMRCKMRGLFSVCVFTTETRPHPGGDP